MHQVKLAIEGMSCMHCVRSVRQALEGVQGVEVMEVGVGSAVVKLEAEGLEGVVKGAVEEEGFQVVGVSPVQG